MLRPVKSLLDSILQLANILEIDINLVKVLLGLFRLFSYYVMRNVINLKFRTPNVYILIIAILCECIDALNVKY